MIEVRNKIVFKGEHVDDIPKNWELHAADICFIGSMETGHFCDWGEFEVLADFEYDHRDGRPSVPTDLVIMFRDGGYMYRETHEGVYGGYIGYDAFDDENEWWMYHAPVILPKKKKNLRITNLSRGTISTEED